MRLTREEFGKLPMQYSLGINRDDYCARKYWNEQFDIHKEVITDRVMAGNIYSGFKAPKVSFYRGAEGKIYDTAQELYEGEFLTPWFDYTTPPVRSGWYKTDFGMLQYATAYGWLNIRPNRWRGMVDVPTKGQA